MLCASQASAICTHASRSSSTRVRTPRGVSKSVGGEVLATRRFGRSPFHIWPTARGQSEREKVSPNRRDAAVRVCAVRWKRILHMTRMTHTCVDVCMSASIHPFVHIIQRVCASRREFNVQWWWLAVLTPHRRTNIMPLCSWHFLCARMHVLQPSRCAKHLPTIWWHRLCLMPASTPPSFGHHRDALCIFETFTCSDGCATSVEVDVGYIAAVSVGRPPERRFWHLCRTHVPGIRLMPGRFRSMKHIYMSHMCGDVCMCAACGWVCCVHVWDMTCEWCAVLDNVAHIWMRRKHRVARWGNTNMDSDVNAKNVMYSIGFERNEILCRCNMSVFLSTIWLRYLHI